MQGQKVKIQSGDKFFGSFKNGRAILLCIISRVFLGLEKSSLLQKHKRVGLWPGSVFPFAGGCTSVAFLGQISMYLHVQSHLCDILYPMAITEWEHFLTSCSLAFTLVQTFLQQYLRQMSLTVVYRIKAIIQKNPKICS